MSADIHALVEGDFGASLAADGRAALEAAIRVVDSKSDADSLMKGKVTGLVQMLQLKAVPDAVRRVAAWALHATRRHEAALTAIKGVLDPNISDCGVPSACTVQTWCMVALGRLEDAVSLGPEGACAPSAAAMEALREAAGNKAKGKELYAADDYAGALGAWEAAARGVEDGFGPRMGGALWANMAAAAMAMGKHADAERYLKLALDAVPFSSKWLLRRARAAHALGDSARAATLAAHAQWLAPASRDASDLLAVLPTVGGSLDSLAPGAADRVVHVDEPEEWTAAIANLKGRPAFVDYSASWCGPCKMLAPHFSALSKVHTHALFLKVDGDGCQDIVLEAGVNAFPTLIAYAGGRPVGAPIRGADVAAMQRTAGSLHAHIPWIGGTTDPAWHTEDMRPTARHLPPLL